MSWSPFFLSVEDVVDIHAEQIARYGGLMGLRDFGLLDSAVSMAAASFGGEFLHADLAEMAAAYAFHIAENQPFLDGNKRTALVSALTFLSVNSIRVLDSHDALYNAMIDVANRRMNKGDVARLLRSRSV